VENTIIFPGERAELTKTELYSATGSVRNTDIMVNESIIRVGIIGLGRSGWRMHAATIERHPQFQVVAVADPQSVRREEAQARYGCAAYEMPGDLIADSNVELVVVATPSHTHAALASEALAASKHVLVEKPFANGIEEADALVEAARRAGKVLTSYHIRRTQGDFLKIREIVDSGVLGPLHLIKIQIHSYSRRTDWQALRKYSGGVLNNLGPHFIDMGLVLAGGEYHGLLANMRCLVSAGDAEDHVKVVFRGRDDVMVDIEISTASAVPTAPPEWMILGRYGALTGTSSHLDWRYYDPGSVPQYVADENTPQRNDQSSEELPWVNHSLEVKDNDPQSLFYDQLYAAIRQGSDAPAPPEELRNLTALFDECRAQCFG
jgi:scyllo-inositol 2-dehydrogenase (NADP+)